MIDLSAQHVLLEGVSYAQDNRHILDNVDLVIPRGKITAVMGPSGVGKTTILKLITGQISPTHGVVKIDARSIASLTVNETLEQRKRMGMLFQGDALFPHLSVMENVAFPVRQHYDLPESLIRDIVLLKLESVGLRGARHLMPQQLSGGMARRVALARAVVLDPEIMFYDEPFVGQDPIAVGMLMALIKRLNTAFNLTTVIVSHDIEETFSIADYVYLIVGGRIACQGTPKKIMSERASGVRQFVHGLPDGDVPFHYPALTLEEDLNI